MIAPLLKIIQRLGMGAASRCRNLYYRCLGVHIRGYIWMRAVEIPRDQNNIELDRCSLDRGVILLVSGDPSTGIKLSIGRGAYINRGTFLDATESLIIGSDVAIGPNCYITDHDHGPDITKPPLGQVMVGKPTYIRDWVWIGANVVVLKGVTIGERTIVGAGSVVTKSLPADVIAAGVPARVIRSRTVADVPPGSPAN